MTTAVPYLLQELPTLVHVYLVFSEPMFSLDQLGWRVASWGDPHSDFFGFVPRAARYAFERYLETCRMQGGIWRSTDARLRLRHRYRPLPSATSAVEIPPRLRTSNSLTLPPPSSDLRAVTSGWRFLRTARRMHTVYWEYEDSKRYAFYRALYGAVGTRARS